MQVEPDAIDFDGRKLVLARAARVLNKHGGDA
jgi:hypothetical protein